MNLIGVLLEIKQDFKTKTYKLYIEKEEILVEKETPKLYKVHRSERIFGYLTNIPKDELGKIKSKDFEEQLERKIWFIAGEYSDQQAIDTLKLSLSAELRRRQSFIDEAIGLVR